MTRRSGLSGVTLSLLVAAVLTGCTGGGSGGGSGGDGDLPEEPDWTALYQAEVESSENSLRQDGIEPPTDAEFIRFTEPGNYGQIHADCMREQGFDAAVTFDGGISFGDIPAEQASAHRQAIHRCIVMYPVHPRYSVPFTEEQIRVIYDYYAGPLTECLVGQGYQVEAAPTWETFLERYDTNQGWHPYDAVQPSSPEEWESISLLCPQNPGIEELYGTEG